jgi:hypothetical protein
MYGLLIGGVGALAALLGREYLSDATKPVTNAVDEVGSATKFVIYGGGVLVLLYVAKKYGIIKI